MFPAALSPLQRWLLTFLAIGWLSIVVGSQLAMPSLIGAAFDGESFPWLNHKLENHKGYRLGAGLEADREWYLGWAQSYASKASALATLGVGVAVALIAFPAARRRVRRFLFASASPLNLGVLRIAAFGMLLYLLRTEKILYYASWPRDMYDWPVIAELFYKFLPITPEVAGPALTVATITTCMAIAGLFTRTSAIISVLLGYYLIGIPQLSGKVNHLHHVLLIGLVLACSRCGDALSIDSLWNAIRRADCGQVAPVRRAVRYGMPIRFAMLVLATVYFFPGFWKIASNGPAWVFSDNLTNHMLQKWFELEHYVPPIPLHKAPFSGPGGALFAVVFEFFLPLALLWKPTRAIWGTMGLVFHNLTNLLMSISFITLQVMYVMFVDWQRVLAWLGRNLYGSPMRVLYDGNCGLCRRTIGVLGTLDWLQILRPINALDRSSVEAEGLNHLDDAALMQDMHAAWESTEVDWRDAKGYAAYQAIAWRVPAMWPLLPILYLPPIPTIGRAIYRRVADSRACRVPTTPGGAEPPIATKPNWSWRPLAGIMGVLLLGQCLLGAGRLHKSWPLACYPLFDRLEHSEVVWPEFTAVTSDGTVVVLDDDPIRTKLGNARYVAPMKSLVASPIKEDAARRTLQEFVAVWRAAGELPDDESTIDRLAVSKSTYQLTGPTRPEAPVLSEVYFEVPWSEVKQVSPEE